MKSIVKVNVLKLDNKFYKIIRFLYIIIYSFKMRVRNMEGRVSRERLRIGK